MDPQHLRRELTEGCGYVVLRGVLSPEQVKRARDATLAEAPQVAWEPSWPGRRKRITNVLELDPIFAEILESLPALAAFRDIVGCDLICGSYHSLTLYDGKATGAAAAAAGPAASHPTGGPRATRLRGMHTDFPWGHLPAKSFPRDGWTCQAIWMLDDFSAENGGTAIVPHSQKLRRSCRSGFSQQGGEANADDAKFEAEHVSVCGKAGDVLVYVGQCWHQSGLNLTSEPRVALLGQFLPYFFAPMEAHAWTLPPRISARFSPALRELLGLQFRHPQRFGGGKRGLLAGVRWSVDTAALIAGDAWSKLGPEASRTESPSNSAPSRLWWAVTVGASALAIYGAQRGAEAALVVTLQRSGDTGSGGSGSGGGAVLLGRLAAATVPALTGVALPLSVGFVFGSMATLQRLWF